MSDDAYVNNESVKSSIHSLNKMISNRYQKVLYDVSPDDFKILDDNHVYKMNSEINPSISSSSYRQIYWSTVAESGLITQQVSL